MVLPRVTWSDKWTMFRMLGEVLAKGQPFEKALSGEEERAMQSSGRSTSEAEAMRGLQVRTQRREPCC